MGGGDTDGDDDGESDVAYPVDEGVGELPVDCGEPVRFPASPPAPPSGGPINCGRVCASGPTSLTPRGGGGGGDLDLDRDRDLDLERARGGSGMRVLNEFERPTPAAGDGPGKLTRGGGGVDAVTVVVDSEWWWCTYPCPCPPYAPGVGVSGPASDPDPERPSTRGFGFIDVRAGGHVTREDVRRVAPPAPVMHTVAVVLHVRAAAELRGVGVGVRV